MSSRVELREIGRRGRSAHLETTTAEVDVNDPDGCRDLLRRMARRHGLGAGDVELRVKTGRRTEIYRV